MSERKHTPGRLTMPHYITVKNCDFGNYFFFPGTFGPYWERQMQRLHTCIIYQMIACLWPFNNMGIIGLILYLDVHHIALSRCTPLMKIYQNVITFFFLEISASYKSPLNSTNHPTFILFL